MCQERPKSSIGDDGFNELRFEDKKNQEEIYIHAQKDFNEVVDHDHSTHVKNDQSNTVDRDQTEHVGHDQTLTVDHDRTKQVKGNETVIIGPDTGNLSATIHGAEVHTVMRNRFTQVAEDEVLAVVSGNREVHVDTGKDSEWYKGGREVEVKAFDNLNVLDGANRNVHVTGQYNISADGHYKVTQNSMNELYMNDGLYAAVLGKIELKAGDGQVHYDASPDGTLNVKGTHSINLEANTKIFLKVGRSTIEITSSKITIASPTVEVNGQSLVDVKSGGLVKLKC
jgi:type VI secretion system secreted protein VgrG